VAERVNVGHALRVSDQAWIEAEFADSFEACRELHEFAEAHRPRRSRDDTPIIHWTLARSDRTFGMVVKLCRLGYGQQASMLNRTLFEDTISAHFAALRPASANRLMGWHEEYVRLRRERMYRRHGIPYRGAPPPNWSGLRKRRMRALFGRGSWTGRSMPQLVRAVETARSLSRTSALFPRRVLGGQAAALRNVGGRLTNEEVA
jgi:hypothetical protein